MPERINEYKGTVSYEKLWQLLEKKGLMKKDLREGEFNLSPTLVTKLSKNGNVSVDTIMYLCYKLDCQPSDIMEYRKHEMIE